MENSQDIDQSSAVDPGELLSRSNLSLADLGVVSLLEIASRRWLWLVTCVGIGWGLAVAYAVLTPKTYESTAKVLVMWKDPTIAASGIGENPEMVAPQITEEMLATHVELLRSHRIIKDALSSHGLDRIPSILQQIDVEKGETPTDYVFENLTVSRGGEGAAEHAHVLNVAFRHTSDVDAQRIVDAIVDRYQKFLAEEFSDINSEAAQLISDAQGDLALELKMAAEDYREFREQVPLLWTTQRGTTNSHQVRFEQFQQELAGLETRLSDAQSRLETAQSALLEMDRTGASDIERLALIDAENVERVNILLEVLQGDSQTAQFQSQQAERVVAARAQYESLLELMAQERTLLADVGPLHPDILATQNRIEVIRDFLSDRSPSLAVEADQRVSPRQLVDAYVTLLEHDSLSAQRRYKELQAMADREEESARSLVKIELEDRELKARLDRAQQLYTVVVDRLRGINLSKGYGGFIHKVISVPELGEPVWPSLPICLVLGTFAGLVLGCGGAGVAEVRDHSFHNPDEIRNTLRLPVLAHIPPLGGQHSRGRNGAAADVLCTLHRPDSQMSEAFRGLRLSLLVKNRENEKPLKVLAVTSPGPRDGKSTVAANLSVSLAQAGMRVLLVDCNLRTPRVHEFFDVAQDRGLTSILLGQAAVSEALHATELDGLSVTPSGRAPSNPADLLTSARFEQFVSQIREHYDYIVLDCPPVLVVSDPCIVAQSADAVLLVLRMSQHAREQATLAQEKLLEVGADLVGTVVNVGTQQRGVHYRSRTDYGPGVEQDGDQSAS